MHVRVCGSFSSNSFNYFHEVGSEISSQYLGLKPFCNDYVGHLLFTHSLLASVTQPVSDIPLLLLTPGECYLRTPQMVTPKIWSSALFSLYITHSFIIVVDITSVHSVWCSSFLGTENCTSQAPFSRQGHVTTSGQWAVSRSDESHSQSEAFSQQHITLHLIYYPGNQD